MTKTGKYGGFDPDGTAVTEADHFGNCPICGAYIDKPAALDAASGLSALGTYQGLPYI
jgi:hypothetical protein